MVAAVERGFGAPRMPNHVEWLSDKGSACIAKDTADTARALGLPLFFTPVRSPENSAGSESFVKTLKRDYARLKTEIETGPSGWRRRIGSRRNLHAGEISCESRRNGVASMIMAAAKGIFFIFIAVHLGRRRFSGPCG